MVINLNSKIDILRKKIYTSIIKQEEYLLNKENSKIAIDKNIDLEKSFNNLKDSLYNDLSKSILLNKKELSSLITDCIIDFKYKKYSSLGRSRSSMPQIEKNFNDDLLIHFSRSLGKNGVKKTKIKLCDLKPTQVEFNTQKIISILEEKSNPWKNTIFFVSKDNYIVDGHHRWAAGLELNQDQEVDCYVLKLPIKELLRRLNIMKVTSKRDVNDNILKSEKDISFYVQKYKEWNSQGGKDSGYKEPSYQSVLEFVQNNYEDLVDREYYIKALVVALRKEDTQYIEKSENSPKNGDIKRSTREGKKAMVYMDGSWHHFGDSKSKHNYSDQARENAKNRHSDNLKGDDPRAKAFRVYWKNYWEEGGKVKKSDEACWDDYEMVGMKDKNGKKVPNCVPKNDINKSEDYVVYSDIIVKNFKGQILFLKRSSLDDFQPNKLCLPGGTIKNNEDPLLCAKRELLEETGIDNCELFFIKKIDKTNYYICNVFNEDEVIIDNNEHENYCWLYLNELINYDLLLDLEDRIKEIFYEKQI